MGDGYYRKQLDKVGTKDLAIQVRGEKGTTKWLNINKESLPEIIAWIFDLKERDKSLSSANAKLLTVDDVFEAVEGIVDSKRAYRFTNKNGADWVLTIRDAIKLLYTMVDSNVMLKLKRDLEKMVTVEDVVKKLTSELNRYSKDKLLTTHSSSFSDKLSNKEIKTLRKSFQEILDFIDTYGREPTQNKKSMHEFLVGSRLKYLREGKNLYYPYLKDMDKDNILQGKSKHSVHSSSFDKWLDTFLEEKGIDLDRFVPKSAVGNDIMPYEVVIEYIKNAPKQDQKKIKDKLVEIDFKNGDVYDFLNYIAKFLVS